MLVDHKKSNEILKLIQTKQDIESLPDKFKIKWYFLKFKTYSKSFFFEDAITNTAKLFELQSNQSFNTYLLPFFHLFGIFSRRFGDLESAEILLSCSQTLAFYEDKKRELKIINSIAIIKRSLNKADEASILLSQTIEKAAHLDMTNLLPSLHNNLGAIHLDNGQLREAVVEFKSALKGFEKIDKRSGIIISLLNLLLTFSIDNDNLSFDRLFERTSRLVHAYPDNTKKAYLYWLLISRQYKNGSVLDDTIKRLLLSHFNSLEGDSLKRLIKSHLAPRLGVVLPSVLSEVNTLPDKRWVKLAKKCHFPFNKVKTNTQINHKLN